MFNIITMKIPLLILLAGVSACFVHAQSNTVSNTSLRLQSVVRRVDPSATNAPTQTGTNVAKPFSERMVSEFIGTLVAVDKEKRTVSIASGSPERTKPEKASLYFLTPETKLFRGAAPATLDDAVIGQEVRYAIRLQREDGKRQVTTLRFLPKAKQDEK